MNYFNITTAVLALLLIALFIRTFSNVSLKTLLENAKKRAIINVKRKEAEEKGEKEFYFERGRVVIYAKTESGAMYAYRKLKENEKHVSRNVKTAKTAKNATRK